MVRQMALHQSHWPLCAGFCGAIQHYHDGVDAGAATGQEPRGMMQSASGRRHVSRTKECLFSRRETRDAVLGTN